MYNCYYPRPKRTRLSGANEETRHRNPPSPATCATRGTLATACVQGRRKPRESHPRRDQGSAIDNSQLLAHFLDRLEGDERNTGEAAAAHGDLGWRRGFSMRDLFGDWRLLGEILDRELVEFIAGHPGIEAPGLLSLRARLADWVFEGLLASLERFDLQRRIEMRERLRVAHDTLESSARAKTIAVRCCARRRTT
jgi:hypothetical protein